MLEDGKKEHNITQIKRLHEFIIDILEDISHEVILQG